MANPLHGRQFLGVLAIAAAALPSGCGTPGVPEVPRDERPPSPPAPVQHLVLDDPGPQVVFELAARDVLKGTPVSGLRVTVDGQAAAAVGDGRFRARVAPGLPHALRITGASHLPLEWSGAIAEGLRLSTRMCPNGVRVVGFGDSLTAGLKVDSDSRFVMKLVGRIQGARSGFWVDFSDRGRSGDTYASALKRLVPDVLSVGPDLTIVEFGTNDVRLTPLAQFPASIDALLSPLDAVSSAVIVVDIPYKARWYGTWNQDAAPFNREIARGAARHGAKLVSLAAAFRQEGARNWDLFAHDAPYDTSLPDSRWQGDIHPNAAGNDLMAQAIADAILELTAPAIAPSSP